MAPSTDGKPGAHSSPGAIPHTVSDHVCVDFVNSRFTDHTGSGQVYDRLDLDEWRRWFANRCGLAIDRPPSALIRRQLIDLRHLLRRVLESGQPPDDIALTELNLFLSPPSQSWQLTRIEQGFELRLVWRNKDWRAVMATTVASYGQLLASGGIHRIKVCGNPTCTFMFYDESRNRSRRWCDAMLCGNLVKVRRHRAQRLRR
jgi:predicted RNA-binding Zn ribbon-like protein